MPLNFTPYCVFDFETGSRNPHKTQPTQLAAIMLDPRTLEIKSGGEFNSEIRAIVDDDKAIELGLDPLEEGALKVTGKTREQIDKAPELDIVWNNFVKWFKKFNKTSNSFKAAIPVGYNINGFDLPIINRLCQGEFASVGVRGKQVDESGNPNLFNKIRSVDMMQNVWMWTESNPDVKSISMDNNRRWLGFPEESMENSHDALQDVKDTGNIFIKFLKYHRMIADKTNFDNAFAKSGMYI
jgi:DNA polymerase III epsilon subunit-like protein